MFEFKLEAVGYIVDNGSLVKDVSKVPMPEGSVNGAIITTNEGHNVTFPSVEFTHKDIPEGADSVTFRYTMSEVIPTEKVNGMTYDTNVYTIDVVVTTNASSDTLEVSAIYPNDEKIVIFKNEYNPKSVTTDINGNKTLIGRDMKSGEEFLFSVSGANAATNNAIRQGIVVVPSSSAVVKDAKNNVFANFAFKNIEFKKAGTYYFAVSETKGSAPAVRYDDTVVNVTVVIDDANSDGNLEVVSLTYDNGKNAAEFTNTYTTEFDGTPVSLEGTKNLTGKSLLDGEFYFNVAEYYNGTFVKEGLVTHTKDTEVESVVYSLENDEVDEIVFNNTYKADETDITFSAVKVLKGRTLKDGEFKFVLKDKDGKVIETVTNGADGKISFAKISFDKAGTYKYTVSEEAGKEENMTYDKSEYVIEVDVTDDGNGKLKAEKPVIKKSGSDEKVNEITFENTYKAPENPSVPEAPSIPKTGNTSNIALWLALFFIMIVVSRNAQKAFRQAT